MKEKKGRSVPKPIISSTERTGIKGEIFPNFFSWKWLHFWVFLTTIDNTHAYFYLPNLLFCSELDKYNQARKSKGFDLSVRKKRWFFDLLYIHLFILKICFTYIYTRKYVSFEIWPLTYNNISFCCEIVSIFSLLLFFLPCVLNIYHFYILSCSCRIWSLEFCH